MFSFIWGGKTDRIKRSSVCKKYTAGGLAMVDIEAYIAALKATWIRRLLTSNHVWTSLFDTEIGQAVFFFFFFGGIGTLSHFYVSEI